jgi:hypothetical protein
MFPVCTGILWVKGAHRMRGSQALAIFPLSRFGSAILCLVTPLRCQTITPFTDSLSRARQ